MTRRYISSDSVPNPFVGRRGSKVGKRRLKLWQKMFPLIVILAVLGGCTAIAIRANGQCCPPTPEPIIREVEKTVFVPVPVFVGLPCANQGFEVGFQMSGPEPMSLVTNLDWRPGLCRLGWLNFDGALGLSGATVGGEAMIGFNAKIGIAFANPGPYFDALEIIWFPKWDSYYYEGVGLRIPVLPVSIGQASVLVYLGGERFVSNNSLGYIEGDTLLFGGAARICRHDFSLGFQAELKAVRQVRDCNDQGWGPGFGIKLFLWF